MFKRKLRASKGETLTETLVALVVVVLAGVALAAMLSAATHINSDTIDTDDARYDAISQAEAQNGTGLSGTVTVSVGSESAEYDVTYYGDEGLFSYKKEVGAP